MKYFQHDLLSREDDKIWELIDRHGLNGYGAWWVILEELYKAEEDGFKVDATETWLKRLAKSLEITDYRTLPRFLDTFAELGLINSQLWQEHIIFSAAVVARGDYYVRQKTLARERKQKERIARKVKAEELAEIIHQERLQQTEDKSCHEDVTRDNPEVTEDGRVMSRTNTDTDPYPYSSSNPSSEDLDPPPYPPGENGAASAPDETKTATVKTSEPAIAVDVLPEDSDQQLDILGSQQPAIPDQQNEDAKGSGKKQKGKSSGSDRAPAKEITKAGFERLRLVYNAHKPELWPECEKFNPKRKDYANRLYQDCDRDLDECETTLQAALEYAQTHRWWNGRDGRYGGGGFATVFQKRRYQEFAEARAMQLRRKDCIPDPTRSEADNEAMRLYQKTLRAIGHVA